MLSLSAAIGYGAAGGSAAEAVVVWGRLHAWQLARHAALADGMALPPFTRFIDLGPDLAVAFTRVLLGCMAGWMLHGQVEGMYAALMVGASAPALLASLGRAATPAGVVEHVPAQGTNWPHEPVMSQSPNSRSETAE
jgi:hypothetical protein